MIFPISHEQTTVRTFPWASFILLLSMVSVFLLTPRGPALSEASDRLEDVLSFVRQHPHLDLDPRVTAATGQRASSSWMPEDTPGGMLQEELNRRTEAWIDALDHHPYYHWGLIPSSPRPLAFLSYLLLHSSWLHLALNLLWLYLCAPFVEDRCGAGPFLAFFLAVGAISGGVFVLRDPGAFVPLIGASGAIAGVVAAFLVLHGRTKMDFLFWFPLFGGTFSAPAWLMIPIWFGFDFWAAVAKGGTRQGGTAYWTHVGGFLAGLAIALMVRAVGISRSVAPLETRRGSSSEDAFSTLLRAVRENPFDEVRRDTLWNLARTPARQRQVAPAMLSGIRKTLREGAPGEALRQWHALFEALPDFPVEPALAVELAAAAHRLRRPAQGGELLKNALEVWRDDLPFPVLDRALRLAGTPGSPLRKAFLELARRHPEADPRRRRELEAEAETAKGFG